jgi:hypothetical protein
MNKKAAPPAGEPGTAQARLGVCMPLTGMPEVMGKPSRKAAA